MRVHLHFSQELFSLFPPPFSLSCSVPIFSPLALTLLNPPLFTLKFTHLFWHARTHTHTISLSLSLLLSSSVFMRPPSLPVLLFFALAPTVSHGNRESERERKQSSGMERYKKKERRRRGRDKDNDMESVFSCVCNWPIKNRVLRGKQFSGRGLAPAGSGERRLWICKWVCKRH